MLINSLDPEVAVATGRDSASHSAIVPALQALDEDESLIVRPGLPAEIFKTNRFLPRVLILSGSPAAPSASRGEFRELSQLGQWAIGKCAAEGWVSTGEQDVLHGTYQIFALAAQKHFGSDLAGKLVVAGGMGRTGGAQPLAAKMNGAAFLGIDVDAEKILSRIRAGYCDICVNDLDEALRILKIAVRKKQPDSVGLVGNCAEVIPELVRRGVVPDLLTDQTPAHDSFNGYIPAGLAGKDAAGLSQSNSQEYQRRCKDSLSCHVAGMLELQKLGAVAFEFGNGLCTAGSVEGAGFLDVLSTYLLPAFRAGLAPVRWFALSGERGDIFRIDELVLKFFPENEILTRWIRMAKKHVKFQGLPGRVGWLGESKRADFGEIVHDLVARGELKAPVVLSREYFDSTAALTTSRKPEDVKDASGGAAEFPVLKALLNAAGGASWASFHRDAGEGNEGLRLSSRSAVANGTPGMAERLSQILAGSSVAAG